MTEPVLTDHFIQEQSNAASKPHGDRCCSIVRQYVAAERPQRASDGDLASVFVWDVVAE